MKKHIIVAMFMAILSGGFILGCADANHNTSTTMQTTKFAGMQNGCFNGGVKIEVLIDGKVDDAQTQYVCNGTQGQDATQEPNGANIAIQTTQFDGVQGKCTNGGVKIEILVDGKVDDAQTQYICNGTQAQSGTNGINTTMQTTKFDDEQGGCTNGGVKIEILVDGKVDDTQTQYICNGTQGQAGSQGQSGANTTMQTTKFDDEQGGCTNGGVKIEVIIDGKVDDAQTQYICNGTQGQSESNTTMQTTKFDDEQGGCTNGGVKIEILINGKVDDTQTQYICNGTQGQAGSQGQSGANATIRTTKFDDEQGGCTNGGVKIEVLVDDKVLSEQTQYICNGINKTTECQTDNSCRETFYCDQTTFMCVNKKKFGEKCTQSNQCLHAPCLEGRCGIIGDIITFGHYEQDNDTTNGPEPIEWRVLDFDSDGHSLIISDKVLDAQPYNTTSISITWEKSTIRSWLNGYGSSYNTVGTNYAGNNFIDTAFTPEEKARIITSDVPAHANPYYNGIPAGNATSDKIFLLSVVEAESYFTTTQARRAYTTLYAVKNGVYALYASTQCSVSNFKVNECYAHYWLRSPGGYSDDAATVGNIGELLSYSVNYVYYGLIGVRPALRVNY